MTAVQPAVQPTVPSAAEPTVPPTVQPAVQPKAMMADRYQRAFTIAVVFLVVVWHIAGAGGQLLHNRADYS